MKKYITIAALATAGAVCANADVTATFSSTGTSISDVDIACAEAHVEIDTLKRLSLDGTSVESESLALKANTDLTKGCLAPDVNVATAGQWQLTLSFSDWTEAFALSGIKIETIGFNSSGKAQETMAGVGANHGTTSDTTTPTRTA